MCIVGGCKEVHLVGAVARVEAPEERRRQPPVGLIGVPTELVGPHAGHRGNPRGLDGQAQQAAEVLEEPKLDRQRRRPRGERVDDAHSDLVVDLQQQLAAPDGVVRVQRQYGEADRRHLLDVNVGRAGGRGEEAESGNQVPMAPPTPQGRVRCLHPERRRPQRAADVGRRRQPPSPAQVA